MPNNDDDDDPGHQSYRTPQFIPTVGSITIYTNIAINPKAHNASCFSL